MADYRTPTTLTTGSWSQIGDGSTTLNLFLSEKSDVGSKALVCSGTDTSNIDETQSLVIGIPNNNDDFSTFTPADDTDLLYAKALTEGTVIIVAEENNS